MIRAATVADIWPMAELQTWIWGTNGHPLDKTVASLAAHYRRVYFENPWYDGSIPSLVNEEADGRITGVLAVMTRSMSFRGRRVRMAVCSEMAVDPQSRAQLVGRELLKTFLDGPQDLSLADMANDKARKIWEMVGGSTSWLHSLHWVRPLRPCEFGLSLIRRRKYLGRLAVVAAPVAQLLDRTAARIPRNPFHLPASSLHAEPLTAELFHRHVQQFMRRVSLRPDYDRETVAWVWERMDRMWGSSDVFKIAVRNDRGGLQGWYVYYIEPGEACELTHIVATDRSIFDVFGHLLQHARQQGALGVTGRMNPRFMQPLSDHHCLFHRRRYSVLVHSRDSRLLRAFERGDAFISQLEGESSLIHHLVDQPEAAREPCPNKQPLLPAAPAEKRINAREPTLAVGN